MTPADYDFLRSFLKERSGLVLSSDKQYLIESRSDAGGPAGGPRYDLGSGGQAEDAAGPFGGRKASSKQ
jgi:hypothetical protein